MKKTIVLLVVSAAMFASLSGCGEKTAPKTTNPSENKPANQETSVKSTPAPEKSANKLIIKDKKVGTGKEATDGRIIVVHYKGWLDDGTVFDTSKKEGSGPFEFQLAAGMVIKGWDMGFKGMKIGGIRELTIPSSLGYGKYGSPPVIPPDATLHFEVELLDVK